MAGAAAAESVKAELTTVDEYIATFPEDVQRVLRTLRETIREVAPEATERISYKIPAFFLGKKPLIYFSGWAKHTSLYPTGDEMVAAIDGLVAYRSGKGTLQFPLDRPLPLAVVRGVVEFRLKDVEGR